MGDVVSLRRARKGRARAARAEEAAQNRVHFGVSKAAKGAGSAERERANHSLEALRRSDETPSAQDA